MKKFKATPEGNVELSQEESLFADNAEINQLNNENIFKAEMIRRERNFFLQQSDWTQLADSNVDKDAWTTYRQALRDIPAQVGFPLEVTFPTQPE